MLQSIRGAKVEEKPKVGLSQVRPVAYFEEVKAELGKIHWTTKEELKLYTRVVVGATFGFGILVYFLDNILRITLHGVEALFRLVG